MNYNHIIINILITALSYMLIPILVMLFYKKATLKNMNTFCVFYCLCVCIVYQVFNYYYFQKINLMPTFLYYTILLVILSCINFDKRKHKKKQEILISNVNNNRKVIYISTISVLIVIVFILSDILIIKIKQFEKLKTTTNMLINDDFVKAEKYIKDNNLSNIVNYDLLVKKIKSPIIQRLDKYSKTGRVIDWYDEYTCKRFNNNLNTCK